MRRNIINPSSKTLWFTMARSHIKTDGLTVSVYPCVTGAKIGHRSLMRYYKQRFGVQRALVPAHNQKAVGRVLKQYRALGWAGDSGKSLWMVSRFLWLTSVLQCLNMASLAGRGFVSQQQKDMQYVRRMKSRWMLKIGMGNNTNKQTHFRAQVMF